VWVFAATDKDPLLSRRGGMTLPIVSTSGAPAPDTAPAVAASSPASTSPAGGSPLNGVFTSAQASRGEQHFRQSCATCHSIEDQASSFRAKWGNGTLRELFTVISTTMPQNSPGSLTPDEYASILALYLRQSGHTPGSTELPSSSSALGELRVPPR
jgi:mono/diheme cytochrome c family protein